MAFVVPLVKREYEICFNPPKHPVNQPKSPIARSPPYKTNSITAGFVLARGGSIDYGNIPRPIRRQESSATGGILQKPRPKRSISMTNMDKRVTWAQWATQFNIPRLRRAKSDRRYPGVSRPKGQRKASVHANVYWAQQQQQQATGERQRKISISTSALDALTFDEDSSDESDESNSVKSNSPSFKKGLLNIFRWRKSSDKDD